MKQSDFSLMPFASNNSPELKITGSISRQQNQLNIKYLLSGNLSAIIVPQSVAAPTRRYDLWEHTCCEFFLGLKDSTQYWEFNLSPSGNWNVFRFFDYRQDIAEEMVFRSLPFSVLQQTDSWQLNLEVDLNKIISAEPDLEVGITTVIEKQDHKLSYWALNHPTYQADFHNRDSFKIDL